MDTATATERINAILAQHGVTVTFEHVPTTFDPRSKEWQCIAWRATFSSPRGKFTTDYRQGIGNLPPELQKGTMSIDRADAIARTLATGRIHRLGERYGIHPTARKLPAPDAAAVVSSLFRDASAADYASFEEWARDMGESTDSRKAEAIYNACRNIALDLNRVFGPSVVEELEPIAAEM